MGDGALNSGADILHVHDHENQIRVNQTHENQTRENQTHVNQIHVSQIRVNQNPMSDQIQKQNQNQHQIASSYSSVCQSPHPQAHAEQLSEP